MMDEKGIDMARKILQLKNRSRSDIIFHIFLYGIAIFLLIVCFYPMYFVLIASFSDPKAVAGGKVLFLPVDISLEGYRVLLSYKQIWACYRNTIFYTLTGTLMVLLVNIPAGYALSRKELVGKGFIMTLFIIPMFFTGGLIPTYMLISSLKLVDTIWVMIIPGAVVTYYVIVSRTFFQNSIPEELWEAAQLDGCRYKFYFMRVVLPLSKAILAVITLWSAVGIWNSYFQALIYLRNPDLQPLQILLRNILITSKEMAKMMEGTKVAEEKLRMTELLKYCTIVVSSAPILCLYPFVQKYFNQGVMIGSIKG